MPRPIAAAAGRLVLTLAIVAAAGGAVAGIGAALANRAAVRPAPEAAAPVPVVTVPVVWDTGYRVTRRFLGQIAAPATAAMAFERSGRLSDVLVRAGDRVPAGAVLARIDTAALAAEAAVLRAERKGAEAQAALARRTAARQAALEARGFAPSQAHDDARYGLQRIEAAIAAIDAQLDRIAVEKDKSVLTAPFAAMIGDRHLDPGATVAPGLPVLTVLAEAGPEVDVGLPPALAASLTPGSLAVVEIDGQSLPATLTRLRPDLDPVTRTQGATFALALPQGSPRPAPGRGVTLRLEERVEAPGLRLPMSALRAGVRGSWEVMLVMPEGAGHVARPEAVEVLQVDAAGAWLRGALPPGARVIVAGGHRVTPGQPVTPSGG